MTAPMIGRSKIETVLVLGSSALKIGEAGEFDYSGSQAIKALKEEGYRVILVNSNPATIMTDPSMADATYIEPVIWQSLEKVIEKESGPVRPLSFVRLRLIGCFISSVWSKF